MNNPELWSRYKPLLDLHLNENSTSYYVHNVKTIVNVGFPLEIDGVSYRNKYDRQDEQVAHLASFFDKVNTDI